MVTTGNSFNSMTYSTTCISLAGHAGQTLYLAIEPEGQSVWSEMDLQLATPIPVVSPTIWTSLSSQSWSTQTAVNWKCAQLSHRAQRARRAWRGCAVQRQTLRPSTGGAERVVGDGLAACDAHPRRQSNHLDLAFQSKLEHADGGRLRSAPDFSIAARNAP